MLAYGLANAIQDGWNEQLWKRHTVDWEIPSMFRPEPSWGWLAIVLGTAVIYVLRFRPATANGPPASEVDHPSWSSSARSAS